MLSEADITKFENTIGYTFRDKALIYQAFTHSSFVNEQKINKRPDYERLEFLGDAVLEMISSAYLFRSFPEKKEGEMSKMRATLVCEGAMHMTQRPSRSGSTFSLEREKRPPEDGTRNPLSQTLWKQ